MDLCRLHWTCGEVRSNSSLFARDAIWLSTSMINCLHFQDTFLMCFYVVICHFIRTASWWATRARADAAFVLSRRLACHHPWTPKSPTTLQRPSQLGGSTMWCSRPWTEMVRWAPQFLNTYERVQRSEWQSCLTACRVEKYEESFHIFGDHTILMHCMRIFNAAGIKLFANVK